MNESPEQRALTASTVTLLVAVVCLALFMPPLLQKLLSTPLHKVANALVLSGAPLLHWVFMGIAARRMQRSVLGWLGLSLLFPIGGALALILLNWFNAERSQTASSSAHQA
jgi:hypothetical protein